MNLELPMLIAAAQLTDAYIRWLAFSSKVSAEVKRRLWIRSIGGLSAAVRSLLADMRTILLEAVAVTGILRLAPDRNLHRVVAAGNRIGSRDTADGRRVCSFGGGAAVASLFADSVLLFLSLHLAGGAEPLRLATA